MSSPQNIMKTINTRLNESYPETLSTLKECSHDTNHNVYLCNSDEEAYDFDKIKETYCKIMKYEDMASMDALIEIETRNRIFLIEFKNKDNLPFKDIRAKVHDSLFILEDDFLLERDMFYLIEIIVVYNPAKKSRNSLSRIREHFKERAGGLHDEIEHFKMFKDKFRIKSLKFSSEDFLEYLSECS
ncbi:hypothetical protein [Enterococcus casseliflavus]|uniref:hypothetical protein n=1 Tax=Enterococcus casseliflavus TaxID=37734 RepID=UPI003D6A70A4